MEKLKQSDASAQSYGEKRQSDFDDLSPRKPRKYPEADLIDVRGKRMQMLTVTIIHDLPSNHKEILRDFKKNLGCGGTMIGSDQDKAFQLQGDHRMSVKDLLAEKLQLEPGAIKVYEPALPVVGGPEPYQPKVARDWKSMVEDLRCFPGSSESKARNIKRIGAPKQHRCPLSVSPWTACTSHPGSRKL